MSQRRSGSSLHRFANPSRFLRLSRRLTPWFAVLAAAFIGAGLYVGLFVAPPDYQQGESVRIMYVHVPAAWMALFVYSWAIESLDSSAMAAPSPAPNAAPFNAIEPLATCSQP